MNKSDPEKILTPFVVNKTSHVVFVKMGVANTQGNTKKFAPNVCYLNVMQPPLFSCQKHVVGHLESPRVQIS